MQKAILASQHGLASKIFPCFTLTPVGNLRHIWVQRKVGDSSVAVPPSCCCDSLRSDTVGKGTACDRPTSSPSDLLHLGKTVLAALVFVQCTAGDPRYPNSQGSPVRAWRRLSQMPAISILLNSIEGGTPAVYIMAIASCP